MPTNFSNLREKSIPDKLEKEPKSDGSAPKDPLPTHPSKAKSTVPDKLDKGKASDGSAPKDPLPTHPSKASPEVQCDDTDKLTKANKTVDPKLDGIEIAKRAAGDGLAKESVCKDEKEDDEKLKEEEKEDEKIKEHIDALTQNEDLSEEFKEKAATVFQAALTERNNAFKERLQKKNEEEIQKKVNEEVENLIEQIDNYLDYIVEEWMKENTLSVDKGLRLEIAETFIEKLKTLFEENNIDIPDVQCDVLEQKEKEMEDLNKQLDEHINKNIELKKTIEELTKSQILQEFVGDLTDTEIEKFNSLVQNLHFESEESFKNKVKIIKENYFPKENLNNSDTLGEDVALDVSDNTKDESPVMKAYADALSASLKK